MKKNSNKSTKNVSDPIVSDQMRDLIVRYMEACNNKDHVSEEALLHAIKQQGQREFDIDP